MTKCRGVFATDHTTPDQASQAKRSLPNQANLAMSTR